MTHSAKPNDAVEIVPKRSMFWSIFWMYGFGSNPKFWIEKWRGQFFLLERLIQRKKDLKTVFLRPFSMDVFSDIRLSKYIDRVQSFFSGSPLLRVLRKCPMSNVPGNQTINFFTRQTSEITSIQMDLEIFLKAFPSIFVLFRLKKIWTTSVIIIIPLVMINANIFSKYLISFLHFLFSIFALNILLQKTPLLLLVCSNVIKVF